MTARIVKKQDHAAEQAPEAVKALAVMCEKGRFSFYKGERRNWIMNEIVDGITKFIFVSHQPAPADIIFLPGGKWPEPPEYAAQLWKEGFAPLILPSGRYSCLTGYFPGSVGKEDQYSGPYGNEWEFMKDILLKNGVAEDVILQEDQAENTWENAKESRKVTDRLGLEIRRGIIVCKEQHARRCLMYYQLSYPKTELLVCPVSCEGITKDNWYRTTRGIHKVLGELEGCGGQSDGLMPPELLRELWGMEEKF